MRPRRLVPIGVVTVLAALHLAGAAAAGEPEGEPAGGGEAEPAAEPDLDVEVELRLSLVRPKFRVRHGAPGQAGTSLRSGEIGVDRLEVGGGGAVRALLGDERITVSARFVDATGRGVLPEATVYDGVTRPAGTRLDVVVLFRHVELEWVHRFAPWAWLRFDAGLAVAWTYADNRVQGLGRTRLQAVYPSPRVGLTWIPVEGVEVWGKLGGFWLQFPNGDTEIREVFEAWAGVRARLGPAFAEVGGLLYQPHLERDPGDRDEEVIHMRLRALVFAFGVAF